MRPQLVAYLHTFFRRPVGLFIAVPGNSTSATTTRPDQHEAVPGSVGHLKDAPGYHPYHPPEAVPPLTDVRALLKKCHLEQTPPSASLHASKTPPSPLLCFVSSFFSFSSGNPSPDAHIRDNGGIEKEEVHSPVAVR